MNYQVGDMLKCQVNGNDAICIIISRCKGNFGDTFKVFWIIEREYVRNTLGYQLWSMGSLDRDFVRLS